jgi:two-component system, OmpR family, sensor kinase
MRVNGKWRPALWMVLGGALVATLAFSFAGLVALRYLGPVFGFRRAAVALALVIGAATFGVGALLVRLLLRPISTLSQQSTALRHDPHHALTALPHYGTRELRDLSYGITSMAAALQNREAQVRSFTDHVTHELKTPVTAIRAAAELLSDGALSAPDQRLVAQILGAADQMQTQLQALRRVTAAREPGHHGTTTLNALLPTLQSDHTGLHIAATGADHPIPLASSGLAIVLGHLLGNAALHGATHVTLHAAGATLTVQDDGAGISDGNRAQIFTPFFTTTRDTGGTGMGLTITANLLRAHGAEIALVPSEHGARFVLTFGDSD